MNPSDSTSKVIETLNFIKINFKNNKNKFLRAQLTDVKMMMLF